MKINDLEKLLNLKRSQIFYYEREGLITPRREGNNYREYDEDDLRRLKAIVVLRKLGFTVAEIQELLAGERDLTDILPENLARLEAQAKELEAARRLCRDMERRGVTMESFDADGWFETIETEERNGHRFLDILGDAAEDANRAIVLMQEEIGFHGPAYANYILSEEGIRRRRPLKLYWLIIVFNGLIQLLQIRPLLLRGQDGGFIHQVLQIRAGKSGSRLCHLLKINIIPDRFVSGVYFQDLFSALDIRSSDNDLSVKTTRTQDCRIENIDTVCCSHDDNALIYTETIHLYKHLIKGLFPLIMPSAKT